MSVGQKCREAQRATCEQEAKCTGMKIFIIVLLEVNVYSIDIDVL